MTLNVGGKRFDVMWRTLEKHPETRLGKLAFAKTHSDIMDCCNSYSLVQNEFFFDIHPRSFMSILNFYRIGKLHVVDDMCALSFKEDLEYWGIDDEKSMEGCCLNAFNLRLEAIMEEMKKELLDVKKDNPDIFPDNLCGRYMKFIWDLMEKPETSFAANCVSFLSLGFIIVSTIGMCLNTLESIASIDEKTGVIIFSIP